MKMNLSAVVLSAVAFFAPIAAYADEVTDLKPGESATGFINPAYGFDQRTELWNTKELVIRHNGVLKRLNVTKYICVPTCYYKIEYVGNIEPKQQINYYDMNQLLRPNSGGQNVPDSEVEKKAKEMGVEKERLKKALADKNEMARLIREIEVKRAEQKKKEKDDQEKQGKGGGGGSSGGGGGGSSGGGGGGSSGGGGGGSSGGGGGGSSGGGGGGSSGGGGGGSSGGGGGSSGGGGGSSGGGGGSSGGGGGGSSGGGGGSSGGGGGSSSSGGSSSGRGATPGSGQADGGNGIMWQATHGDGTSFYGDSPDTVCSQWYSYVKSVNPVTAGDYTGIKNGFCTSHAPKVGGGQAAGIGKIPLRKDIKQSMNNQCGSSPAVVKMKGASFSVICTEKAKDTNFGGASVGSLGGNSSTSSNNSTSSSSSGSGAGGGSAVGGSSSNKGNGAGATAGVNGANDGGRAPSAGGGTAQNSSDSSSNKTDSSNSNKPDSSNSGHGNSNMGGSDDPGKKSDSSSGESNGSKKADSDGNSAGNADGNGDGSGGEQYGLPDVPDVPDGGGEPDWNGIKSDGNFGTFSPSSAFATGGQCPQDILLDFGQFGRHSFSWSPICEAAQRLRYVFITLAYFMAAMMVYKTVNSMRG